MEKVYENNFVKGYDLSSLKEGPIEELEILSEKAAADGIVLLKNDNDVLPLKKGAKVAVFGRVQREYYKSGTGSGGLVNVKYKTNIVDALIDTGYVKINKKLLNTYTKWIKDHPFDMGKGWAAEPWCQEEMELDISLVEKAKKESDTAIIVIGRTAGEDKDNSAVAGSYLLSEKEEEMIKKVTSVFDKVCVILNVGNIIDMKWVEKYSVPCVLYVWQGGMRGGSACADILCGFVTPNGHLSDTVAYHISDYPSTENFGDAVRNVYREDIYVGYRYFETFAKDKVLYPFGYGLSYTDFDIKCSASTDGKKINIEAVVENTGDYDGKDALQVYYEAPQGKLGKPSRELIAFEKTKLLAPKEIEEINICFNIDDMASYDDSGLSGNKNCYVLEAGEYKIYLGEDIRSAKEIFIYNLEKDIVVKRCEECLTPSVPFERIKPNADMTVGYESVPTRTYNTAERIKEKMPEDVKYCGDKGIKLKDVKSGKNTVKEFLSQLTDSDLCALVRGEGMNSPKVTPGTGCCFGGVTKELIDFGFPVVCGTDGPSGIRLDSGYLATSMPSGVCLACTFDKKLIYELYTLEGIEMTAYKIDVILGPGINIHRSPLNGRNFEYFSEDPLLTGKIAAEISKALNSVGVCCTAKHFMANNQEWHRHDSDSVLSERAVREIYAKPFEIAVKEGNLKALMTSYNIVNGNHAASNYDLATTLLRDEWGYKGFVMTDWWAKMTDSDGNESKTDIASMVKSQNDIYMVVSDAKDNDDNLMQSLDNGYLNRAELIRCAKNLINHIMYTHAYERFEAMGYTYDIPDTDISKMERVFSCDEISLGSPVKASVEESGKYILAAEVTSDGNSLAQTSMKVFVNQNVACSLVTGGTDGKAVVLESSLSLIKGEFDIKFETSSELLKIHNFAIYK